jgi:hypothetical protein
MICPLETTVFLGASRRDRYGANGMLDATATPVPRACDRALHFSVGFEIESGLVSSINFTDK